MTIKFIKHKARRDYEVRIFKIKKGDEILKICFSKKDIHVSRNKTLHLDIWGKKLEELKEIMYKLCSEIKISKCLGSRFMNTEGKIKILKNLEEEYNKAKNNNPNEGVDISLILFLRNMNKIDGIVTTESCEGHSRNDGKTCCYGTAVLFIWPSEKMAKKFREKAFKLANAPGVERVSNYSNTWEREVICITFVRNTSEKKKDHNKAKKVILSFFRQLEVEIGGKQGGYK